jgi:hypothetical protein
MDLLSSIEWPHWLMIAGAVLVAMGFLGHILTRNKQADADPDPEPPVAQLPPLPRRLESSRRKKGNDDGTAGWSRSG